MQQAGTALLTDAEHLLAWFTPISVEYACVLLSDVRMKLFLSSVNHEIRRFPSIIEKKCSKEVDSARYCNVWALFENNLTAFQRCSLSIILSSQVVIKFILTDFQGHCVSDRWKREKMSGSSIYKSHSFQTWLILRVNPTHSCRFPGFKLHAEYELNFNK